MKENKIKFLLFFFFFLFFEQYFVQRIFTQLYRGKKFWGYVLDMNNFKLLKRREYPNFKKK